MAFSRALFLNGTGRKCCREYADAASRSAASGKERIGKFCLAKNDRMAAAGRLFSDAREDMLNVPLDEVSLDLIACAGADWNVDSNTAFMDRLAQIFAALNVDAPLRTVILGCNMQRELTNGGIPGSRNIVFSPERKPPKQTGIRLMYVDGIQGLLRTLRCLRVPHAWVIGGADTYRDLVLHCRRAYIVQDEQPQAGGQHMPALASLRGWLPEINMSWDAAGRGLLRKFVNRDCQGLEDAVEGYGQQYHI